MKIPADSESRRVELVKRDIFCRSWLGIVALMNRNATYNLQKNLTRLNPAGEHCASSSDR
jgi:hypothetical protein